MGVCGCFTIYLILTQLITDVCAAYYVDVHNRLPGALIHFEPESPTLAMHVLKVETYNVTLYKDTNRNRLKSKDNINELKFETFVNFVPIVLKRNQENIHS